MKVGIILVYVGEVLPEYFELWVKSAENNPEFDFYVFTDRAFEQYEFHIQCPKNVYWIVMDFRTIKERIQKHVDFKIHLKTAYKLCDYKPLYGLAFEDYLMGYDWWGHCDGDIIFGSLKNFITDEKLRRYEKIYRLGHLTLYKNEDKINHLWKADVDGANYYKHVYRLGYSMFFDEDFGINRIAEHCQIKCLNDVDCADIWIGKNRFWTYWDREYGQYDHLFSLEDGHLYGYIACEEKIIKKEYAYAHFQKRKMSYLSHLCNEINIMVVPNSFIHFDETLINYESIRTINDRMPDDPPISGGEYIKLRLSNLLRGAIIQKIIRRERHIYPNEVY